ncbi:universal stress protein [Halococcus sp. AFM35]|uniref:universal stress protein n=1 Tax=Halococcus sp. AFM35 TaxID=3421653 RepID=UPI003EB7A803
MTEHVLVPIDGSPRSERALEHALGLPDVTLTAITVINPFDTDPNTIGLQSPTGIPGLPGYSEEWYEGARAEVEELHAAASEQAAEEDIALTSEIEVGDPARRIIDYIGDNDVDHVVIGSHDRTDLARILLGSVAERVVRRSPVPVTVVR